MSGIVVLLEYTSNSFRGGLEHEVGQYHVQVCLVFNSPINNHKEGDVLDVRGIFEVYDVK